MKRLFAWGWLIIYSIILTGVVLGVFLLNQDQDAIEEEEKLTLTFRHFWTLEHDRPLLTIFEDVVNDYQASNPNVKITIEGLDQTIHREQKLKSEMVTGTPPDLFLLFGGAEIKPYITGNRLMDLTAFAEDSGLNDAFKDLHLWKQNDRLYGLPIEGNAETIFYNKTIFKELGLQLPQTVDELTEVIAALREAGYVPFALGNIERWPAAIYMQYLMDRYAGPHYLNELAAGSAERSFVNSGYKLAYEQFEAWVKAGAFQQNPNTLSVDAAIDLFTSGEAAMYFSGNWDITLFSGGENSVFANEVGVMPFPSLHTGQTESIAGGYTLGIGLSASLSDKKKEAALGLLKLFFTEDIQARIVNEGLRVPAMKIDVDAIETGPIFESVIKLLESADTTFVPYDNVLSPEVKQSFLEGIEGIINGELTSQEALQALEESSRSYWRQR